MNTYIKIATGEFPLHEGDIRLEYPEILESQTGETFPCPDTYAPLFYGVRPTYDERTQYLHLLAPSQRPNGMWKAEWEVRNLTAEQIEHSQKAEEEWLQKRAFNPVQP
jgi:hypothetical protein